MANRYSDLPPGAVIETVPGTPPMQFSDLPPGAVIEAAPPITPDNTQLAPATDGPSLIANLRTLTKRGATPDKLREYVAASGGQFPEETQKWLDEVYANNPQETSFDPIQRPAPGVGATAIQGLTAGGLMGWDDELNAQTRTAANWLGSKLGLNESNASWDDIYNNYLQENQQYKDAAYAEHPWTYAAGFVPGMVLNAAVTRGRGAAPTTMGGRAASAGLQGAVQGAASGAGNSAPGARWEGAGFGAMLGGPTGIAVTPLASAAGNLASRLWSAVGMRNAGNELTSGLGVLASHAPQDAQQLADNVAQWRASGVEPRLVDVVDESGRGVIRDVSSKMTPARDAVVKHAEGVYADAQGRVADQARRHISSARQTARQLGETIKHEQEALGPQFDAVRGQPVQLTPEIVDALNTTEATRVLRSIGRWMTPAEKPQLDALVTGLAKARKLGTPEQQAEKLFPGFGNLKPEVQQNVMGQMVKNGQIVDPLKDLNLTVDVADKFARMITKQAQEQPAMTRVASDYADKLRGAARRQYGDYDRALNDFEASARVGDAAAGTGRFEGTDFLRSPADQYGDAVAGARANPPPNAALPSEMDALRMRARDQVVDAANESAAGAASTARKLSQGGAQQARSAYLIGGKNANALSNSMGNELKRVTNTRFIDPNIGSQTASKSRDAIVDGFEEAVANIAHTASPKWAIIRMTSSWLRKAGIRNVDAERLGRDAISTDPARVDAAIKFLSDKGMARARADRFIRTLGGALGGRAAGATQTDGQSAPLPNSVRALHGNFTPAEQETK